MLPLKHYILASGAHSCHDPPLSPCLSLFLAFAAATGLHAQAAPPDLSDPEVAHVAVTANSIDIELAKLAQSRTRNQDVKQFATTMITDHSAVNAQATALATKLGVTPKDNAVSQSLLKGAAEARATIEPLKGKAFDKAYIDREVAYHQAVHRCAGQAADSHHVERRAQAAAGGRAARLRDASGACEEAPGLTRSRQVKRGSRRFAGSRSPRWRRSESWHSPAPPLRLGPPIPSPSVTS